MGREYLCIYAKADGSKDVNPSEASLLVENWVSKLNKSCR